MMREFQNSFFIR